MPNTSEFNEFLFRQYLLNLTRTQCYSCFLHKFPPEFKVDKNGKRNRMCNSCIQAERIILYLKEMKKNEEDQNKELLEELTKELQESKVI